MSERMFFDTWAGLGRTLMVGVLAYAALVSLLRISGKRTLSKMNTFDLVVTVALGSTLATVLLSKDVALAEASEVSFLGSYLRASQLQPTEGESSPSPLYSRSISLPRNEIVSPGFIS